MTENTTDASESPVERAVQNFQENPVADLLMESTYGQISDEPRTIRGEFPGSKDRAMGHAQYVVEVCEDHDVSAEIEYVGEMDDYDLHEIDIVIEGGE